MQAAEVTAQSGFPVRKDLGTVDVDGEGGGGGIVGDVDDTGTLLEEVFEDGKMGLVVHLAPNLILKVVMFESLKTVDADVEVGSIKKVSSCDLTRISVPENTQQLLIIHEIFRDQYCTTFLYCSRQLPKDARPRLARQVVRNYCFPA